MKKAGSEVNVENGLIDHAVWVTETERLCQRYIDEVVLPFGLCPWAAPALQAKTVKIHVITDRFSGAQSYENAASNVLQALAAWDEPTTELVLVVLPRCEYSRLEMDDLLRAVRHEIRPVGQVVAIKEPPPAARVPFALAAFHPDAAPDTHSPERLIPFLRRSPDPMIQAVRTSTLARIDPERGSGTAFVDLNTLRLGELPVPRPEPLRLRVARANAERCQGAGLAEVRARLDEIRADWTRTRSRLIYSDVGEQEV